MYLKKFISIVLITVFLLILVFKFQHVKRVKYAVQPESKRILSSFKRVNINNHAVINSNYVTVISIYFCLNQSKHSQQQYSIWMQNFFSHVKSPVIMFSDPISGIEIKSLAENRVSITLFIVNSIWDVLKLFELERGKNYITEFKKSQYYLDPELWIHNSDLYAIWSLKAYLINLAVEANVYNSKFFIFTDAGAWRGDTNEIIKDPWPNHEFTSKLEDYIGDKVLFGQIRKNELDDTYIAFTSTIQATFMAGTATALKNFSENYYRILDSKLQNNEFGCKDQLIMSTLVLRENYENAVKLNTWKQLCKPRLDEWWFYQIFFSSHDDYSRICQIDKLSLLEFN
jgi:hypothetical protein